MSVSSSGSRRRCQLWPGHFPIAEVAAVGVTVAASGPAPRPRHLRASAASTATPARRDRWTAITSNPAGRAAAGETSSHANGDVGAALVLSCGQQMSAKVDAGWWRMAMEYGLFDHRWEFLFRVNHRDSDEPEPECAWVGAWLPDEWDLAGSGPTALGSSYAALFTDRFVPEFSMLSLDHRAMFDTTVWVDETISIIVIAPISLRTKPHRLARLPVQPSIPTRSRLLTSAVVANSGPR